MSRRKCGPPGVIDSGTFCLALGCSVRGLKSNRGFELPNEVQRQLGRRSLSRGALSA